jgi:hypothetical protein
MPCPWLRGALERGVARRRGPLPPPAGPGPSRGDGRGVRRTLPWRSLTARSAASRPPFSLRWRVTRSAGRRIRASEVCSQGSASPECTARCARARSEMCSPRCAPTGGGACRVQAQRLATFTEGRSPCSKIICTRRPRGNGSALARPRTMSTALPPGSTSEDTGRSVSILRSDRWPGGQTGCAERDAPQTSWSQGSRRARSRSRHSRACDTPGDRPGSPSWPAPGSSGSSESKA